MSNIRNILGIAMAFVGVVVGAGFASGQEVLQFFSSFGYWGLLGGVVSGLCFTILGMAVGELSQVSVSHSFKEGLYLICGPRLGVVVDIMITFFMYAIAVVMFAGGGSLMEQQWGVPAQYGSVAVMLITVLIVFLRVDRVMAFIGSVTPILVLMMVFLCIYSWNTRDLPLEELDVIAHTKPQGAGHWLVGALLYVSYNMVVGAPFLMIAGAQATSRRNALLGGLVGGLLLGFLIVLISAGVFGRIDTIGSAALPMLMLAT
ncbi:MAG: YkvI family membrane protein, partial [Alcaligenes aquatilis]